MVKCDICGREVLRYGQYWESGVTLDEIEKGEKLLLTVCKDCDKAETILDSKNTKTKVLRDWVKIQPEPVP